MPTQEQNSEIPYSPAEVIFTGFRVDNFLKDNFIKKLNEILENRYELRVRNIEMMLMPAEFETKLDEEFKKVENALDEVIEEGKKAKKAKKDVEGQISIKLMVPPIKKITFHHRNVTDYNDKKLLISCNDEIIMKKIISQYEEVLKNV